MSRAARATAALFPGQGVSLEGARELALQACRREHEHACELLGQDPFVCAHESTRFAQPAIFLASIAAWRAYDGPAPLALAGHSLGELSALTAARALAIEDALELVVLRGTLMAQAGEQAGGGSMLAVLKGTIEQAQALAREHGVSVANDNAPGQTILSGERRALDRAAVGARGMGLRAMRLDVAGAFHSPAMLGARRPFEGALSSVAIAEPTVPVLSGMTAAPFGDIRRELADALTRPVRWRETLHALAGLGARRFVDVGPDRVLARLVARNLPQADVEALAAPAGAHA